MFNFNLTSMASLEFDTVKAEKDAALWRYNMEKKLRIGLRFVGFLLALFLLFWSWFPMLIPDTIEVAGDLRRRFVSAFNKPLFTFVVVNIIIVSVYALSSQKQNQNKKTTNNPNIYDEYVSSSRSIPTSAAVASAGDQSVVDKQIVLVENAVALSPLKQQPTTVGAVTETKISLLPIPVKVTKTKPNVASAVVKQSEYQRTRSMVPESRNQRRRPKEFRRSETDIMSKDLVISGTEPPRKSMDEMSSEEFQSIIDSFIAEKKKTLMQENTAHYTRRKEKCMSIVVQN